MPSTSSSIAVKPVSDLIEELGRLPGIGPKSASRLAFSILRGPREEAVALAEAILTVKERVFFCSRCFNITETEPCAICSDPTRDPMICVVEEPLDVLALDRTGQFRGKYHVLHGAISPIDGIGPGKLRIAELIERVKTEKPEEVILATNLDMPGEATASILHSMLVPLGVRVTRPATGLPAGGDLEYADDVTLARALAGRRTL